MESKPKTFSQFREEKEWEKELRKYLKDNLVPFIVPMNESNEPVAKKYREIMISNDSMKIWKIGFTHPSYNIKTDFNNDTDEFLGDKMLGYCSGRYFKTLFPWSTQENLTNFNRDFTSRGPLAIIAREKGMLLHIRTLEEIKTEETKNTIEIKKQSDIFEAVVNCITEIGDKLISPGVGFALAFNFITSSYNWFREEHTGEQGKSGIINKISQDYYDNLGWKERGVSIDKFELWNKVNKTFTLFLSHKAVLMLDSMGKGDSIVRIKEKGKDIGILAKDTGEDKADARSNTYQKALNRLNNVFGLNENNLKNMGLLIFLNNQVDEKDANNIYNKLQKRFKEDGIDWIKQTMFKGSNRHKMVYSLYGYRGNKIKDTVFRIMFSSNPKKTENGYKDDDIRMIMLKSYADKGSIPSRDYYYYNLEPKK